MSNEFEILYLKIAIKDLDEIFDYIKSDNPRAASALLDKFDKTISKLSKYPKVGRAPKDDRLKNLGYRVLIVENYLVFYVIKNKKIEIRRVLHGARNYKFLF